MTTQTSIKFFRAVEIQGKPCIMGKPDFEVIPFYGLQPGQKVTQIGCQAKSGKETSSSHIDKYEPWVEYAGVIEIYGERWMAFKCPPGGVTDYAARKKDRKPVQGEFYVVYQIFGDGDLLVPSQKKLNTYLYRGKFTLYEEII